MQKSGENIPSADRHKSGILGNVTLLFIVTENLKFFVTQGLVAIWRDIYVSDYAISGIFQWYSFHIDYSFFIKKLILVLLYIHVESANRIRHWFGSTNEADFGPHIILQLNIRQIF